MLNVRDFGAVGDGTGNDAPAIQRALDAFSANAKKMGAPPTRSGGVYLPLGDYRVTSTLQYVGNPGVVVLGPPGPRTRIVSVTADTTEAYAAPASPATLQVGKSPDADQYLKPHDISSGPLTSGLVNSDLGQALKPEAAVQGGDFPNWNASEAIVARLTATGGTLGDGTHTSLKHGFTTFYITLDVMP